MLKKLSIFVLVLVLVGLANAASLFSTNPNPTKVAPTLTIMEPTDDSRVEDTIKYDGPNAANGIGLTAGGTFYGAVRFTPVDPCSLKSAIFYLYGTVSAPGYVYIHGPGTATAPGPKLDSVPYTGAVGIWNRVNFTSNLFLPSGTDFWLNLRLTHVAGQYPFGVDAGPSVTPARSFVSTDGSTYSSLASLGLNYNWNLRAIVVYRRFNNDVGVDAITAPGATHRVNTPMIPIASVKNYGQNAQTSFAVVCSILGPGGVVRHTNTQTVASLAAGATTPVSFTSWTPTIQEALTVMMKTTLAGDENTINDRKTRNTQIAQELLSEGFNDPTFPPTGWQAVIGVGTYNWQYTTAGTYPSCTPYEGAGMATYQSWYASSGNSARLISPAISVSGATQCSLKFWMMHDPGYSSSADLIQVQTSTNGTTFTTIATFNRYAATQEWTEHSVYLGEFTGNFYIAFNAVSAYGNNMYMDYVRVTAGSSVPQPQRDVGVEAIRAPGVMQRVNQAVVPIALVKNYGLATMTSFPVVCSIVGTGGAVRHTNTQTVATLAPNDTIRVNFTSWTPTITENVTVIMRTNLTNDSNPANDRKTGTTAITNYMLQEGFESTTFPPAGWQSVPVSGTYNWSRATSGTNPVCTPFEGTAMAYYPAFTASAGNCARLISPAIAAGTNTPCTLKFNMYHDDAYPGGGYGPDSVKVETSTNGTTFNRVAAFVRYDVTNAWQEHTVYLGLFTGNFYLGMLAWSDYGDNLFIDNLRLAGMAVEEEPGTTVHFTALNAVRPNPVKGIAHISFNIAEPTPANLRIYDASGRLVKTLFNSTKLDNGVYNLIWNGTDGNNRAVSEGIYFYTLETNNNNFTKKLVLTR